MSPVRRNVLLIDDNQDFAEILAIYFAEIGLNLIATVGREAALQVLQQQRPIAAIVDWIHPFWDPSDAIREMQCTAPGLPVFVTSPIVDDAIVAQVRGLGVQQLFPMPYDYEGLVAAVRRTGNLN